jgi:hypothetical protein
MDVRLGTQVSIASILARVPDSSEGGYQLSLETYNGQLPGSHFLHLGGIIGLDPPSNYGLAGTPFSYTTDSNTWFTLVFTLQNNAAGTEVMLNGKVFPQGQTGGTPLAELSYVDTDTRNMSPGQVGFKMFLSSTDSVDVDNFTADVGLSVNADDDVTLTESHYLTSLIVHGELTLSPGGNKVLVTNDLSVTGRLDITDNDLIVDYTGSSPITDIEADVASGYNVTGDWLGDGITSSTASLDGNYTVAVADNAQLPAPFGTAQGGPPFSGVDVDLTTVLVKFTHRADVDLDGLITPNDASIFGTNYSENDFANWAMGDMDYDGLFTPNDASIFGTFYDESLLPV